jgi:hypothetical protein
MASVSSGLVRPGQAHSPAQLTLVPAWSRANAVRAGMTRAGLRPTWSMSAHVTCPAAAARRLTQRTGPERGYRDLVGWPGLGMCAGSLLAGVW